jgi:cytochrome P450 family 6
MMLAIYFVVCLIALVVVLIKRNFNAWKRRGFYQIEGIFPFGSLKGCGTKFSRCEAFDSFYRAHKGKTPAVGYYSLLSPQLLLIDPQLIKNVIVRDFPLFHDRAVFHNKKYDPLASK